MNDPEIEPDEDILVKDLITVRGRITDAYNHAISGRKISCEECCKSAIALVNEIISELRGAYDDECDDE